MLTLAALVLLLMPSQARPQATTDPNPGQLQIVRDGKPTEGLCPLERTDAEAWVSGFGAEVKVVQSFVNPSSEAIEAIYTFPLPHDAAVNRMRMKIGDRTIEGSIRRREEARRIYEAAKSAGQTAGLLDQERPNIFTQSVANIPPGARVQVEISYVQLLKYENDEFEFVFPMVVGPRYLGNAPDPEKIAPPITPKGTRTGANIGLTVHLDAGSEIQALGSTLHQIETTRPTGSTAEVRLAKRDEIPNRDFILRYRVASDTVKTAFLTHMDSEKGGFFSLVLLPPRSPQKEQIASREIIFVMDQSGSQSGLPIEKSKELTLKLIDTLRPGDTFNVVGFNTAAKPLWPAARPFTPENVTLAKSFVRTLQAGGGTNVREGVVAALDAPADPERLRIVLFNTDGFVGDEDLVLDTIQKRRDRARMFLFGIGNSVNRFLIEAMATEGRGDSEVVTLNAKADESVTRLVDRLKTPILTDVQIEIEGGNVTERMPMAVPDVFDNKPIVIHGRYERAEPGVITVTGRLGGSAWAQRVRVQFPASAKAPAVASLWARSKVDSLERQSYLGTWSGEGTDLRQQQIVDTALEFGIMTRYTSFVAVEPRVVNVGGKQWTVRVPVEMADGVSYEEGGGVEYRFGGGGGGGLYRGMPAAGGAPMIKGKSVAGQANAFDLSVDAGMEVAEAQLSPEARFLRKVSSKLREAKGRLVVQVWLSKVDAPVLEGLAAKGLKVEVKDAKLRVVFGTVDAANLRALAQIAEVQRIEPIE